MVCLIIKGMKIIDAHAHVFKELTGFGADGELRAIGGGKAIWATGDIIQLIPEGCGDKAFTAETYISIMDKYGIEKAVLLQGGFLGFQNYYVKEVMEKYPDRFISAATFDPFCRNSNKIFDNLITDFSIFKFEMSTGCGIMGSHPDFRLDNELMMPIYKRLAENGKIVEFDLGSPGDGSNQPDAIANIAAAFPELRIVVCHLMSPRRNHEKELTAGLNLMNKQNIFFDLAALHHKVRPEDYPFPTAQRFIRLAIDIVGTEKLMWGTDAPSTLNKYSMDELISYQKDILSPEEARLIFHDNAEKLYFRS